MFNKRLFAAALLALTTTTAIGLQPAAGQACVDDAPCKLSVDLPDGDVLGVWPTPDGRRVVFFHRTNNGPSQLYSVPVAGGSPIALTEDDTVFRFVAISPDNTRVLYLGRRGPEQPLALFSVPITGPAQSGVQIASNVSSGDRDIQVSRDKVVYVPAAHNQLRVVPIAGPQNAGARLTRPFGPGGFGGQFEIEDGAVVYTARQDSAQSELYRVPLTLTPAPNPPTTKLNGPLVAGGNVGSFRLVFRDIVYRADQDTDEVFELYRAHLNGSGKVKLNVPLPSTAWEVTDFAEAALGIRGYDILPDSSRVVYEIDNPFLHPGRQQLYSVPIAGPASNSVRLDDSPGGAPARDMIYLVSSDSQRIIYEMVDTNESFWLLSVPVAGPASANTPLNFPSPAMPLFKISPNGLRTVYLFENGNGDIALFSVPTAGPVSHTVRIDRGENPTVPLLIDSNSTKIVYATSGRDLFSAPIDGSNDPVNLTESLNSISISRVSLTANGRYAVYTVKRNGSNFFELYSSRLVPTAPANR